MSIKNKEKVRKNFVFSSEINQQLEKLKAVKQKSATEIVQDLIIQSYQDIEKQEKKQALKDFLEISANMAQKVGDFYQNKDISLQSIKAEMAK
jgi:hypothetical protein